MLHQGVRNFRHPFHQPAMATATENGVAQRTVILRDFSADERILVCHSDARAPKIRQISHTSAVSWLFYHPKRKIQVRIRGIAFVHAVDRIADEQWEGMRMTSRLNYCAKHPPGTPLDGPPAGTPQHTLEALDPFAGRENFAAIVCRFDGLDCLRLGVTRHRRVRFDWKGTGMTATWLEP